MKFPKRLPKNLGYSDFYMANDVDAWREALQKLLLEEIEKWTVEDPLVLDTKILMIKHDTPRSILAKKLLEEWLEMTFLRCHYYPLCNYLCIKACDYDERIKK